MTRRTKSARLGASSKANDDDIFEESMDQVPCRDVVSDSSSDIVQNENSTTESVLAMSTSDFVTQKRRRRNSGSSITVQPRATPVANRFEPLAGPATSSITPGEPRKTLKLPPVILPGHPTKQKEFIEALARATNGKFHIKYSRYNTIINIHEKPARDAVVAALKKDNVEFFTFGTANDKKHAFVLRGLEQDPAPDDIIDELKSKYGVDVLSVSKMRQNKPNSSPLFMVLTSTRHTVKQLTSDVKYLCYVKIKWERLTNKRGVTQCHNCQQFNHAATYCNMPAKCVKCGQGHHTSTCKKSLDEPATCANCKGPHTANSTECPAYIRVRQAKAEQQQRREKISSKPRFVPAPPPSENAWTKRAALQRSKDDSSTPGPQHQIPSPGPSGASDCTALFSEMRKLGTLVNMQGLLQALKDLNAMLETCQNGEQKFMVVMQFTNQINKYNL